MYILDMVLNMSIAGSIVFYLIEDEIWVKKWYKINLTIFLNVVRLILSYRLTRLVIYAILYMTILVNK